MTPWDVVAAVALCGLVIVVLCGLVIVVLWWGYWR